MPRAKKQLCKVDYTLPHESSATWTFEIVAWWHCQIIFNGRQFGTMQKMTFNFNELTTFPKIDFSLWVYFYSNGSKKLSLLLYDTKKRYSIVVLLTQIILTFLDKDNIRTTLKSARSMKFVLQAKLLNLKRIVKF